MEVPLVYEDTVADLALVRFNFVPEGMSRKGAKLSIDSKTKQATFEGVHCEKENKSFVFQGPVSDASGAEHILLYNPASGIVRLKKIRKLINLKNVRKVATRLNGLLESPNKKPASKEIQTSNNEELDELEAELLGDLDTFEEE